MIDAINRLIENPSLRQSIAQNALATVDKMQLSWQGNAEKILQGFKPYKESH
jgi:glycosyltransferase involved in cell wall biosynthesis